MDRFRPGSPLIILLIIAGAAFALLTLLSCGDVTEESLNKTLSSLAISPAAATLEAGTSVSFSCNANYSDGSTGAVIATWTLSGEVGTVTAVTYYCAFLATREGSGTVNAAYGGLYASAPVTVTAEVAPGLATIEVSPANYAGRLTGWVNLTAAGKTISGEAMAISPSWTLSGDPIGTLTGSGETASLEVTAEGTATIKCASGEVSGYAYITIEGYVLEITVEADTYVDEANSTEAHGGDTSLKAGYVNAAGKHYETYVRFPLTLIPAGASIEAAVLKLYPSNVSSGSAALQVCRLDGAFTDATSWETKPTSASPFFLLNGTFTAGAYNELSGDPLLTLVRGWVAGTQTNYGLAVLQGDTTDGTVTILSLEYDSNFPLLRLEYTK